MSTAASTSKTTTANTLLYKKSKDVKRLPAVVPTDIRRTLAGFRCIPEFLTRRDPSSFPDWNWYGAEEKSVLTKGYWAAYDEEYKELEGLWLDLYRKEEAEAEKRRSEEEKTKKKKEKKKTAAPKMPVTLGSGKGKGKEKEEIEVINLDSESETDMEFRETCVGCERAKLKCVFNYNSAGKKSACNRCVDRKTNCSYQSPQDLIVQRELRKAESFYHQYNLQVISGLQWSLNALSNVDGQDIGLRTLENQLAEHGSVPENLQDTVIHGWSQVIEHYNNIAQMCRTQMKSISVRHRLGKGFGGCVPLLNRHGEVDLSGEMDSGMKRRRPQDEDTESGPSKRPRVNRGMAPEEVEVEKEKGPEVVPNVDKGKGKRRNWGLRRMWKQ
ncbi:hypothetical protein M422DRAFT_265510 [Sphaerobolus stellatus SS14]|uniref:Zn(2)-C6 fungal-type domain-containing protein n=1 Tax=Sphaerobolus stellatus (strain SS14) TaxID=990650 RepID=A0A0C9UD24_SPHS4|nr:hypothetical protein M422DRAFT_265510 [Sphaerobolus stellatus SS14]